jgi:hypothetical protein
MKYLLKREPVLAYVLATFGVNVAQVAAFNPTWLHIAILVVTSLGAIPVRKRTIPYSS